MEIQRDIIKELLKWKDSDSRRPMLIQGARQIGKTWVMKYFGRKNYKQTAYFNFDSNQELKSDFQRTKDPARIIELLRLYTDSPIEPHDTLIIFDEIQESPEALNSLKYFCEEAPEYHVMAAGSLLGIAIHRHRGFPVGKVDFIKMYPVTFKEFLYASSSKAFDYIENMKDFTPLPGIIDGLLWDAYRQYQVCGGMPRAALAALENRGLSTIVAEQNEILTSYYLDFSKHAPTSEFPKIAAVWQSLPSQLSKENRKFIYKIVKNGARAREYENALNWLKEAGLIYQIYCLTKPALPISAYDDLGAFKIYMLDIGLLRQLADLPPAIFTSESTQFIEFKGALAENTVLQNLLPAIESMPRYWVSSGTAEIDFIIQNGLDIIPIEVKSSLNTSSKSLAVYISKYTPPLSIILSSKELSLKRNSDGTSILYLPLPLTPWISKFLSLIPSPNPAI